MHIVPFLPSLQLGLPKKTFRGFSQYTDKLCITEYSNFNGSTSVARQTAKYFTPLCSANRPSAKLCTQQGACREHSYRRCTCQRWQQQLFGSKNLKQVALCTCIHKCRFVAIYFECLLQVRQLAHAARANYVLCKLLDAWVICKRLNI